MKRTKWIFLWISVIVCGMSAPRVFSAEPPQKQYCMIEKLVMTRAVERREPVDESTDFDAALGKVYCWMKVKTPTPPTTIKHIWYRDDQKVFQLTLEIKYVTMRTWSVKGIAPGNWRVDVVDKAEHVIGSVNFQVK